MTSRKNPSVMHVSVRNLGAIKQADFDVGDLTVT